MKNNGLGNWLTITVFAAIVLCTLIAAGREVVNAEMAQRPAVTRAYNVYDRRDARYTPQPTRTRAANEYDRRRPDYTPRPRGK